MKLSRIKLIDLRIIRNSKGNIMKYLDKSNPNFKSFGEVYFSEIKKNMSKGWILHKKSSCFLAVPFGKVKFTFSEKLKSKKKIIIIEVKIINSSSYRQKYGLNLLQLRQNLWL